MFSKLVLHHWRQFNRVEIDFHRRLTVLTGVNGSGKTTILHLLNRHWGWDLKYVSSPSTNGKEFRRHWAGFWGEDETSQPNAPQPPKSLQYPQIGELVYWNGKKARLSVPREVAAIFDVDISSIAGARVAGVYVPSHRPPYVFRPITEIPVKFDAQWLIFETYVNEVRTSYTGGHSPGSPSYQLKRLLISLALFGYGSVAVEPDEEAVRIFEGFEHILRVLLPESLRFKKLKIRGPDILLSTDMGEISLEAVSGGVAAVIDMAWQIHMYAQLHEEFVVVIDEPEAHLHPALQQRLLPDLLTAFPKAQFVIATHSPFMVTSVPDSNVYVLNYNAEGRVDSKLLDRANKAGSADEILMDVLGVPSTIPQWARAKIDSLLEEFSKGPFTQDSVGQLKTKMSELGMARLFPEALAAAAEAKP
jgi:predicted ATPase